MTDAAGLVRRDEDVDTQDALVRKATNGSNCDRGMFMEEERDKDGGGAEGGGGGGGAGDWVGQGESPFIGVEKEAPLPGQGEGRVAQGAGSELLHSAMEGKRDLLYGETDLLYGKRDLLNAQSERRTHLEDMQVEDEKARKKEERKQLQWEQEREGEREWERRERERLEAVLKETVFERDAALQQSEQVRVYMIRMPHLSQGLYRIRMHCLRMAYDTYALPNPAPVNPPKPQT